MSVSIIKTRYRAVKVVQLHWNINRCLWIEIIVWTPLIGYAFTEELHLVSNLFMSLFNSFSNRMGIIISEKRKKNIKFEETIIIT